MKSSHLRVGLAYLLAGAAMWLWAAQIPGDAAGLLWGFGGACFGPGAMMVVKYFYWSAPQRRDEYAARQEEERIALSDELQTQLRDKSGRYAYNFGMLVLAVALPLLTVLDVLGMELGFRFFIIFLAAYLLLQLIAGWVIFARLSKKYY